MLFCHKNSKEYDSTEEFLVQMEKASFFSRFFNERKRYSEQLETAPKKINFPKPKLFQIKKNSNFTRWKHHLPNAFDHKN